MAYGMIGSQTVAQPFGKLFEKYGKFAWRGLKKYQPYEGDFLAVGPAPEEQYSIERRREMLPQLRDLGTPLLEMGRATAEGSYMDPNANPWLSQYAEAAIRPIETRLFQEALPRITSRSVEAGSYSGVRPGLVKVAATEAAAQQAGDVTAKLYADVWDRERARQFATPAFLAQSVGVQELEPAQAAQIGAAVRGFEQQAISNELQRWEMAALGQVKAANLAAPAFQTLPAPMETYGYMPSGGGGGGGGGTGGAISGALGGAGAAMSAVGALGAANIWNPGGWALLAVAAAGAAAGGTAGYLGGK